MKKVTNMALILQNLDNNRSDDILDVSNFKEHHFDNLDLNDSTTNTEIKLNTLLSDSSIRPYLDSNDTSLIDSSTALDHMNTNINTHGKVNTYSSNFRSKGESKDSEELHYIVNAWAPQGHEFQAHNQYRAMATYNKNIYVFSLDKQSRRPYINKINSIDNTMQTSLLDKNEDEIYSVFDDSHHRFAIAIDKEGYIHVIGDMHHGSGGSGKGGSYRQLTDNPLPQRFLNIEYGEQMYWVSDNPEDVSSFTFVGNDANRHFPCNRTTYNYFRKDNNGVLYMAGRQSVRQNKSHESGTLGLCLAKYDTSTKTWNLLGGVPEGGYEGLDIGDEKVYESILWEPHGYNKTDVGSTWYQSYSSNFKFDTNNTMHLVATINADTVHNGGTNMVYSYSKDGGNTFNRLDRVTLNKFPLRVNGTSDDNSSNQIDSAINQNKDSVIYEAWYPGLFFDSNSSPAVIYKNIEDINNSIIKYRYFDKTSSEWKDSNILTRMEDIRADSYTLLDGSMLIIGSKGIQRIDNFGEDGITYKFDSKIKASFTDSYFLREVDIDLLRTKNILRGIAQIDGRFAIITVY